MKERKDLLAYCGFYCGDCLGHTGVIADAARDFMRVLKKYKFDRTAKSVFPKELKDYDKFCQMLGFMAGLKCEKICRETKDLAHLARLGNVAEINAFTLVMNAMTLRFARSSNHFIRGFIMIRV